jgi:hypothetical protein
MIGDECQAYRHVNGDTAPAVIAAQAGEPGGGEGVDSLTRSHNLMDASCMKAR